MKPLKSRKKQRGSLVLGIVAAASLLSSIVLWPNRVMAVEVSVLELVGPTAPILAILGSYSIACLLVAPLVRSTGDLRALLHHAYVIAGINWTVGMIGTYLALQLSLSAGVPSRAAFSNALTSTLVGLVNMVAVMLVREFISRLRGVDLGRDG